MMSSLRLVAQSLRLSNAPIAICVFIAVFSFYHILTGRGGPDSAASALADYDGKTILIATTFFVRNFSENVLGRFPATCPYKCRVLYPEWLDNSDVAVKSADALFFHNFAIDLVPALRRLRPLRRKDKQIADWFADQSAKFATNKQQIWALLSMETMETIQLVKSNRPPVPPARLDGLFNAVVSYRRDSHVFSPYMSVLKFEKVIDRARTVKINHQTLLRFPTFDAATLKMAKKTRHLAAVVSNCKDSYGRLHLLEQLASFGLSVDIYGKCSPNGLTCPGSMSDECYSMLSERYFFYASFENSICADYVTEKFFNVLNYDMVPVVVGGANLSLIAAPENSFIDATLFNSAEALASFLLRLAADQSDYLSYFEWKRNYHLVFDETLHPLCGLCKQLNDKAAVASLANNVVSDFEAWLVRNSQCRRQIFTET